MKQALKSPVAKGIIGLLIGIGLLFIVSRVVNIVASFDVVLKNLTTPRGAVLALLSGVAFVLAFSIRGLRWKLFLNTVSPIKTSTTIRVYLVGIFVNFLFSFGSGEVAKAFMLKRIAGLPMSRSLPTVAMDRSLDLLPSLVLMIIVPLLGMHMEIALWIVLATVAGVLIVLVCFVGLTVWKRNVAMSILSKIGSLLPRAIGGKIESFATGFVESLIASASRPRIFLPAIALTCLAVMCDGLVPMLIFWSIGLPVSYATALFGYTLFNLFYILPNPPGQVGSTEAAGLLVFTGLLHLPSDKVAAMYIFCHPWAALVMCVTALVCVKTLGLRFSATIGIKTQPEESKEVEIPEEVETPMLG
jgi:uncharacterized protein (TIRG00374 family)